MLNRTIFVYLGVLCYFVGLNSALAQNITDFTKQFNKPQFIENNDDALKFRLALLDNASKGATVRVATFVFDYGDAVETLAAHMCKATRRGVHIELISDAKGGEIAGIDNAYDGLPMQKKSEELLQYLTRCGVKVFIHNYNTSYVNFYSSLLSNNFTRLPNIFGVPDGSNVNVIQAGLRLSHLRQRISEVVRPTLDKLGVRSDLSGILSDVQGVVLGVQSVGSAATDPTLLNNVNGDILSISSNYRAILTDPFWSEMNAAKMRAVTVAIQKAIEGDPELKAVRANLRVFNRLNHRKLFLVQDSGESCVIIGGRNLGDAYLTSKSDSYRDGDVFFCSKSDPSREKFFKDAQADLNQLEHPSNDPVLGPKAIAHTVLIRANRLRYQNLDVRRIRLTKYSAETLKGEDLNDFSQPVLLLSAWDPKTDQVRAALLRGLDQEQKEAYIETAYAEFDAPLKTAIEGALKRGVRIRLVTNGMFISDGASQLIRLWMAHWIESMEKKYSKDHFQVAYAPLSEGHMIHFKGAGFRCQKDAQGNYYRTYIVGSHNFHPRSSYSDKENSLEWQEATDSTCPEPTDDLIAKRIAYYQAESKIVKHPVLATYPTLFSEVNEVASTSADAKSVALARAILQSLYLDAGSKKVTMVYEPQFEWIEYLLDVGGLRDYVGELL